MFFLDEGQLNVQVDGKRLYRRMFSEEEFGRRFGRLFAVPSCLYMLSSPGLGYGLSWLLDNQLPEDSTLVVFETGDMFNAEAPADLVPSIRRQRGVWEHLKRALWERSNIFFCPEHDAEAQLRWLNELLFSPDTPLHCLRRVQEVQFCAHLAGVTAGTGTSTSIAHLVNSAIRHIQQMWNNHSTAIFMSHLWIKNAFTNSFHNPGNVKLSSLASVLGERDIILCGAGTSLEGRLETLAQAHAEGATVAAVDTALPTLIECGIVPELVFVLEGQFANMDDLIASSVHRYIKDSLLVHDMLAHPATLRLFRYRAAFFSHFAQCQLFDMFSADVPLCPALGSVGPTALYILLRYSRARVHYCGFDFAFPRGQSHARSAPAHQNILRNANRFTPSTHWTLEVPRHRRSTLQGAPALSDDVMASYSERFSEILHLLGKERSFPFASLPSPQQAQPLQQLLSSSMPPDRGESFYPKMRVLYHDLVTLKASIARLLELTAPGQLPENADSHPLWAEVAEKLKTHDFLWRFLPGQKTPHYASDFLIPLSKNMIYWINYTRRFIAERHVQ